MKLTDLGAEFLTEATLKGHRRTDSFAEAQGIMFQCPKCFAANNGPIGTHYVMVWFSNVAVPAPAECFPRPRWKLESGTSLADLTLSPSILLPGPGGCEWHGFVRGGDAS